MNCDHRTCSNIRVSLIVITELVLILHRMSLTVITELVLILGYHEL